MKHTKEKGRAPPKGRRRLEFGAPKQQLPLLNKAVYMDIKNSRQADFMEEQLKKLGARVEKFLSVEVNYVISSSGPSKPDEKVSREENPQSPSFVPSPFNCGPSPAVQPEAKTVVVSRGKALAQIACAKNKASSVVTSAEKLGIKVVSADAATKWLEKEIRKMKHGMESSIKENKSKKTEVKLKHSTAKSKLLTGSFIKVEDCSRHYRPVKVELDRWPRLNLSAPPGICPFGEAKVKVQNLYGARNQLHETSHVTGCVAVPAVPSHAAPIAEEEEEEDARSVQKPAAQVELVGVPIVTTGDAKRILNFHFKKNLAINKQQGYCDCCGVKFQNIDEHLKGEEHRAFARQKSNYESLDALISQIPSTVDFLQSVLLKHCVQRHEEPTVSSCPLTPFVNLMPPISPLTTEKINEPSQETAATCLKTPDPSGQDIATFKEHLTVTDTDLISKRDTVTPTKQEPVVDSRPQAVVIRRPMPSGMFTSPRRRPITPSKKPWMQERSLVFSDSPIGSLQPSPCTGKEPIPHFLYDNAVNSQNKLANVCDKSYPGRPNHVPEASKVTKNLFSIILNQNFAKLRKKKGVTAQLNKKLRNAYQAHVAAGEQEKKLNICHLEASGADPDRGNFIHSCNDMTTEDDKVAGFHDKKLHSVVQESTVECNQIQEIILVNKESEVNDFCDEKMMTAKQKSELSDIHNEECITVTVSHHTTHLVVDEERQIKDCENESPAVNEEMKFPASIKEKLVNAEPKNKVTDWNQKIETTAKQKQGNKDSCHDTGSSVEQEMECRGVIHENSTVEHVEVRDCNQDKYTIAKLEKETLDSNHDRIMFTEQEMKVAHCNEFVTGKQEMEKTVSNHVCIVMAEKEMENTVSDHGRVITAEQEKVVAGSNHEQIEMVEQKEIEMSSINNDITVEQEQGGTGSSCGKTVMIEREETSSSHRQFVMFEQEETGYSHGKTVMIEREDTGSSHGQSVMIDQEETGSNHGKTVIIEWEETGSNHGQSVMIEQEESGSSHGKTVMIEQEESRSSHGKTVMIEREETGCSHGKTVMIEQEETGCSHGKTVMIEQEETGCSHGKTVMIEQGVTCSSHGQSVMIEQQQEVMWSNPENNSITIEQENNSITIEQENNSITIEQESKVTGFSHDNSITIEQESKVTGFSHDNCVTIEQESKVTGSCDDVNSTVEQEKEVTGSSHDVNSTIEQERKVVNSTIEQGKEVTAPNHDDNIFIEQEKEVTESSHSDSITIEEKEVTGINHDNEFIVEQEKEVAKFSIDNILVEQEDEVTEINHDYDVTIELEKKEKGYSNDRIRTVGNRFSVTEIHRSENVVCEKKNINVFNYEKSVPVEEAIEKKDLSHEKSVAFDEEKKDPSHKESMTFEKENKYLSHKLSLNFEEEKTRGNEKCENFVDKKGNTTEDIICEESATFEQTYSKNGENITVEQEMEEICSKQDTNSTDFVLEKGEIGSTHCKGKTEEEIQEHGSSHDKIGSVVEKKLAISNEEQMEDVEEGKSCEKNKTFFEEDNDVVGCNWKIDVCDEQYDKVINPSNEKRKVVRQEKEESDLDLGKMLIENVITVRKSDNDVKISNLDKCEVVENKEKRRSDAKESRTVEQGKRMKDSSHENSIAVEKKEKKKVCDHEKDKFVKRRKEKTSSKYKKVSTCEEKEMPGSACREDDMTVEKRKERKRSSHDKHSSAEEENCLVDSKYDECVPVGNMAKKSSDYNKRVIDDENNMKIPSHDKSTAVDKKKIIKDPNCDKEKSGVRRKERRDSNLGKHFDAEEESNKHSNYDQHMTVENERGKKSSHHEKVLTDEQKSQKKGSNNEESKFVERRKERKRSDHEKHTSAEETKSHKDSKHNEYKKENGHCFHEKRSISEPHGRNKDSSHEKYITVEDKKKAKANCKTDKSEEIKQERKSCNPERVLFVEDQDGIGPSCKDGMPVEIGPSCKDGMPVEIGPSCKDGMPVEIGPSCKDGMPVEIGPSCKDGMPVEIGPSCKDGMPVEIGPSCKDGMPVEKRNRSCHEKYVTAEEKKSSKDRNHEESITVRNNKGKDGFLLGKGLTEEHKSLQKNSNLEKEKSVEKRKERKRSNHEKHASVEEINNYIDYKHDKSIAVDSNKEKELTDVQRGLQKDSNFREDKSVDKERERKISNHEKHASAGERKRSKDLKHGKSIAVESNKDNENSLCEKALTDECRSLQDDSTLEQGKPHEKRRERKRSKQAPAGDRKNSKDSKDDRSMAVEIKTEMDSSLAEKGLTDVRRSLQKGLNIEEKYIEKRRERKRSKDTHDKEVKSHIDSKHDECNCVEYNMETESHDLTKRLIDKPIHKDSSHENIAEDKKKTVSKHREDKSIERNKERRSSNHNKPLSTDKRKRNDDHVAVDNKEKKRSHQEIELTAEQTMHHKDDSSIERRKDKKSSNTEKSTPVRERKKSNNDKLLDSTHHEYEKEKEGSHHERISVDEQRNRKKSSSPLTNIAVEEKTKGKVSNCESFSVVGKDKAGFNYKEVMPVERKDRESSHGKRSVCEEKHSIEKHAAVEIKKDIKSSHNDKELTDEQRNKQKGYNQEAEKKKERKRSHEKYAATQEIKKHLDLKHDERLAVEHKKVKERSDYEKNLIDKERNGKRSSSHGKDKAVEENRTRVSDCEKGKSDERTMERKLSSHERSFSLEKKSTFSSCKEDTTIENKKERKRSNHEKHISAEKNKTKKDGVESTAIEKVVQKTSDHKNNINVQEEKNRTDSDNNKSYGTGRETQSKNMNPVVRISGRELGQCIASDSIAETVYRHLAGRGLGAQACSLIYVASHKDNINNLLLKEGHTPGQTSQGLDSGSVHSSAVQGLIKNKNEQSYSHKSENRADNKKTSFKMCKNDDGSKIGKDVHGSKIGKDVHGYKIGKDVHGSKIGKDVHDSKIGKDVHDSEIDKNVHVSKIGKDVHKSKMSKDVHVSKFGKDIHVSKTSKDVHVSIISKDVHVSIISKDVHGSKISKDVDALNISKDVHISKISKDVHDSKISKDVHVTKISKDVHGSKNGKDVHDSKISKDVHVTKISKGVHGSKIGKDVHGSKNGKDGNRVFDRDAVKSNQESKHLDKTMNASVCTSEAPDITCANPIVYPTCANPRVYPTCANPIVYPSSTNRSTLLNEQPDICKTRNSNGTEVIDVHIHKAFQKPDKEYESDKKACNVENHEETDRHSLQGLGQIIRKAVEVDSSPDKKLQNANMKQSVEVVCEPGTKLKEVICNSKDSYMDEDTVDTDFYESHKGGRQNDVVNTDELGNVRTTFPYITEKAPFSHITESVENAVKAYDAKYSDCKLSHKQSIKQQTSITNGGIQIRDNADDTCAENKKKCSYKNSQGHTGTQSKQIFSEGSLEFNIKENCVDEDNILADKEIEGQLSGETLSEEVGDRMNAAFDEVSTSIITSCAIVVNEQSRQHLREGGPVNEDDDTDSLLSSENVHNEKGNSDEGSDFVELCDRPEIVVVPNIAERVKSRSRVGCLTPSSVGQGNQRSDEEKKTRRKRKRTFREKQKNIQDRISSQHGHEICDTSPKMSARNMMSSGDKRHKKTPTQRSAPELIIPNIAESVKNRRSCTFFNHPGQYASSGEGSDGEEIMKVKSRSAQKSRHRKYSSRERNLKALSLKSGPDYDKNGLVKHSRILYSQKRSNDINVVQSQDIKVEQSNDFKVEQSNDFKVDSSADMISEMEANGKTSNFSGNLIKIEDEASDLNSAVVVRRRKPNAYPSNKRPEVDWGKVQLSDGSPEQDHVDSLLGHVAEKQQTCAQLDCVRKISHQGRSHSNTGSQAWQAEFIREAKVVLFDINTSPYTNSHNSNYTNIHTSSPNRHYPTDIHTKASTNPCTNIHVKTPTSHYTDNDPAIHRSRYRIAKPLEPRDQTPCSKCPHPARSISEMPSSPGISCSPRLRLKIRRQSGNKGFSSTLEEIHDCDNIVCTAQVDTQHCGNSCECDQQMEEKYTNRIHHSVSTGHLTHNCMGRGSSSDMHLPEEQYVELIQPVSNVKSGKRKIEPGTPHSSDSESTLEYPLNLEATKKRIKLSPGNWTHLDIDFSNEADNHCARNDISSCITAGDTSVTSTLPRNDKIKPLSPNRQRSSSPCFSSPVTTRHFQHFTTPKKNHLADKPAVRSQSPVFNLSRKQLRHMHSSHSVLSSIRQSPQMEMSGLALKNAGLQANVMLDSSIKQTAGRHTVIKRLLSQPHLDYPSSKKTKVHNSFCLDAKSSVPLLENKQEAYPFDNFAESSNYGFHSLFQEASKQNPDLDFKPPISHHLSSNRSSTPEHGATSVLPSAETSQSQVKDFDHTEWATRATKDTTVKPAAAHPSDSDEDMVTLLDIESFSGVSELGLEDLLNQVQTFSSPEKATDTSWGDICDSYLSISFNNHNTQTSGHPVLGRSPAGREARVVSCSPRRKQLKNYSGPLRKRTVEESERGKTDTDNEGHFHKQQTAVSKYEASCSRLDTAVEQELQTPVKHKASEDLNLSPYIQQVDDVISFNFMSPQRLKSSPQDSSTKCLLSPQTEHRKSHTASHSRRLFSPEKFSPQREHPSPHQTHRSNIQSLLSPPREQQISNAVSHSRRLFSPTKTSTQRVTCSSHPTHRSSTQSLPNPQAQHQRSHISHPKRLFSPVKALAADQLL